MFKRMKITYATMFNRNKFTNMEYRKIPNHPNYFINNNGYLLSDKSGKIKRMNPKSTLNGYIRAEIDGVKYYLHQLVAMAWLGHIPNGSNMVIDHINEIKTDNRLCNLRVVHHRDNCNRNKSKHSKYTGVSRNGLRFISQIRIDGKLTYLGTFNTEEEAYEAYKEKRESIDLPIII